MKMSQRLLDDLKLLDHAGIMGKLTVPDVRCVCRHLRSALPLPRPVPEPILGMLALDEVEELPCEE